MALVRGRTMLRHTGCTTFVHMISALRLHFFLHPRAYKSKRIRVSGGIGEFTPKIFSRALGEG